MKRKLSDILKRTDRPAVSTTEHKTLFEAAQLLCEHRIGSLLVMRESDKLVGILSERDLMRHIVVKADFDQVKVGAAMSADVIVATENDDVQHAMNVMTERRIRHLPVMRDAKVVGVVSIGDVVNEIRVEDERHIQSLHEYMSGSYR